VGLTAPLSLLPIPPPGFLFGKKMSDGSYWTIWPSSKIAGKQKKSKEGNTINYIVKWF